MLLGEVVTVERRAGDDVRRAGPRLERELVVLHLPLRAGDRARPAPAPPADASASRSRDTSTRRATCSPRTTRSRRSRRASSSRSSTPAATPGDVVDPLPPAAGRRGVRRRRRRDDRASRCLGRRRRRVLDRAPRAHPLDRQPDDRPLLEAMRPVLLVLLAEGGDRRGVLLDLARLRLQDLAPAVEAEPGELRPVLRPAVDEERDLGEDSRSGTRGSSMRVVGLAWVSRRSACGGRAGRARRARARRRSRWARVAADRRGPASRARRCGMRRRNASSASVRVVRSMVRS